MPLAGVLFVAALASGGAQSAATLGSPPGSERTQTSDVAQMFADAPDGVDPIVTGPVSAAFRQQQADAGCDRAVWPNIPAVCYPD